VDATMEKINSRASSGKNAKKFKQEKNASPKPRNKVTPSFNKACRNIISIIIVLLHLVGEHRM